MQLSDFSLLFPPSRNAIQTVKLGQLLFYQGILNEYKMLAPIIRTFFSSKITYFKIK